ncbi:MAG: NAD(P)-dependent oxidoreductase [Coriobacteriia bacterium]
MRLLVVGASGRTGSLLMRLALDHGHDVTVLVRDGSRIAATTAPVCIVRGDVLEPDTLPQAVTGQDAIISVAAPRPRTSGRVYVEGTRNLAEAAERAGIRRFVVVSAEGAGVSPHTVPVGYRLILRIPVVARLYPDLARMERELIARNGLDWTIVRAAVLTNGPRTGAYRTAVGDVVRRGLRVSRADLAEFLLTTVETGDYIQERVALAR